MSRRTLIAVFVGLVVAGVFTFFVVYFLLCINRDRRKQTRHELSSLTGSLRSACYDQDQLPGSLQEAIKAVQAYEQRRGERGYFTRMFPMLVRNRDAWGRPFVYELKDHGRTVVVRSLGRNGKDEKGEGDDIQSKASLDP